MKLTESAQSIQEAAELIRELNYQLTEYQYMLYRMHKGNVCIPVYNGDLACEIVEIIGIEFSVKNGYLDALNIRQLGMQSNYAKLQDKVNKLI